MHAGQYVQSHSGCSMCVYKLTFNPFWNHCLNLSSADSSLHRKLNGQLWRVSTNVCPSPSPVEKQLNSSCQCYLQRKIQRWNVKVMYVFLVTRTNTYHPQFIGGEVCFCWCSFPGFGSVSLDLRQKHHSGRHGRAKLLSSWQWESRGRQCREEGPRDQKAGRKLMHSDLILFSSSSREGILSHLWNFPYWFLL